MELVLALVVGLVAGAKWNAHVNGAVSKVVELAKAGLAKIKS